MKPFTVRRARAEDQEAVAKLWMSLLTEHASIDDRFVIAEDALLRWHNDYGGWLKNRYYRIFVAEKDGIVGAFVTAQVWYPPPVYAQEPEIYINEIYCTSPFRGQGLASGLVQEVRTWASEVGARRLRMGALARNAAGLQFWREIGAEDFSITLTIQI